MFHLFRLFPLLLLAGVLLSGAVSVRAQTASDSVVTAALGVPADSEAGAEPAVYLTWWPTGTSTWTPQTYAIYSKDGRPEDPGQFTLAGLVQPQVDPVTVQFLLNRATRVGEDLTELSDHIDGLYDKTVPVAGMQLAEKLAAIIAVSELDPESAETLALLSRRHPAAALAAGVAFVDTLPEGETRTYEIRTCPDGFVDATDCNIISGRVTVTGGKVRHLPAPGQPVHVPFIGENGEPDPRGNLNVPLRWATPDPLREQSFFQFGFDVYRASAKFAEKNGWDSTPPARDEFLRARDAEPGAPQRVNSVPILTDQQFDSSDAADLRADPDTYFVIDDNDRFEPGGVPFEDGDRFYYFVAARDLLGRPGEISAGTPVTICFKIPPEAPRGLTVSNHYSWDADTDTQTQVFKLNWEPAETREHGPEIAGYWIYRWESIDQMQQMQGLPFSSLPADSLTGGRIATVPAGTTEYIDNVGPHPSLSYTRNGDLDTPAVVNDQQANQTYWYTVRAIDASSCGGNISGNSAPAFGVLRDRVGPEAPSGSLAGNCLDLIFELDRAYTAPGKDPFDPNLTYLEMSVAVLTEDFSWAEFYIGPTDDERAFIGRFGSDQVVDGTLTVSRQFRTEWLIQQDINEWRIFARMGAKNGQTTDFVEAPFIPGLQPDPKMQSYVQIAEFAAMSEKLSDCTVHLPVPADGSSNTVTPVELTLNLTPGSEEWKLYRQVDDGPLSLLRQGLGSYDEDPLITVSDADLPLNGGRICYYLQVFDLQGNPSIMRRIGCITAGPRTSLPRPMLSAIQPLGQTPETGGASIHWFAPPAGIERFELWIHAANGLPDPTISDELRPHVPPPPGDHLLFSIRADSSLEKYSRAYVTGRVGANFDSGPDFSVDWTENFSPGTEYFVRVRAIGAGGVTGPWSHEESFIWSPETDFSQPFDPSDCVVPWPVRGTPLVSEDFAVAAAPELFEVGLEAEINPENPDGTVAYSGGAVRVGAVRLGNLDVNLPKNWNQMPKTSDQGIFQLPLPESRTTDLEEAFYQKRDGTSVLDFMLFRYQIPNAMWPSVSGDVYQVSPMIEGIANSIIDFQGQPALAIHDPYVFLIPIADATESRAYHLYIKDTQPVIQGARYRYLVARFDESGEIAQIIPLSPVTAN